MANKASILCSLLFVFCCTAWGQKNPCNPTGAPYTSLPGDTTIILKGGTQVTFNRCEFFDLRDCLEFDELFDQQSIETAGFTTQDRNGNILLSCGMFRIRLNPGCTDKTCFEVPVKVRMPFRLNFSSNGKEDSCGMCNRTGIRLFTSDGGAWSDTTTFKYEIIDIGGQKYFEFYAHCPNKAYNCDCRKAGKAKVKFKAQRGNRIEELIVRSTCPVGVLKFTSERPKRKIKVTLPCPVRRGDLIISATGTGPAGETVNFEPKQLSRFEHNNRKRNCKQIKPKVIRRILGIFPIRDGYFYRKYFIR